MAGLTLSLTLARLPFKPSLSLTGARHLFHVDRLCRRCVPLGYDSRSSEHHPCGSRSSKASHRAQHCNFPFGHLILCVKRRLPASKVSAYPLDDFGHVGLNPGIDLCEHILVRKLVDAIGDLLIRHVVLEVVGGDMTTLRPTGSDIPVLDFVPNLKRVSCHLQLRFSVETAAINFVADGINGHSDVIPAALGCVLHSDAQLQPRVGRQHSLRLFCARTSARMAETDFDLRRVVLAVKPPSVLEEPAKRRLALLDLLGRSLDPSRVHHLFPKNKDQNSFVIRVTLR
jgi:hypothetical protein